jgi:uncharacterized protein (TIGR02145 family)
MTVYGSFSQKPTITLTFTAIDSAANVQLDSIKVMNRTQGGDTVLYYPDTVLVLDFPTGIQNVEMEDQGFEVFQNYPNPLTDQTTLSLYVTQKDRVTLIVSDIFGREKLKTERMLEEGMHSFRFTPGKENLYFFTARYRDHGSSIKIVCAGSCTTGTVSLEYSGSEPFLLQLKVSETTPDFAFTLGDTLLYIGYADTLQSGMLDTPEVSQTYTFQFATNIPCPGTPTVEYEGQVYNTIQIFSQCWLKENLNVGTMILGDQEMTDNDTIEKYCFNNEPDSCTKYGGLYHWDEMMQYTTQQGNQGICPPGWHIPTDEEWKVLEGAADGHYGIGSPEWDDSGYRGYDAGTNLKTTSGWYQNGNGTDLLGFSGMPGGYFIDIQGFLYLGFSGFWWTSKESGIHGAWCHNLARLHPEVERLGISKYVNFSVRCLRDE